MNLKALCLCTSSYSHQLDHLAVLSHALQIPFLLTDPLLYDQAKHFYPFTETFYLCERDCSLEFLSKNYDVLFISCKNWTLELSILMKELFNKPMRFCFCPHGNSDKGHVNPSSDLLRNQDLSLIYGNHMKDMLSKRGVLQTLQGTITTGNYRYRYYLDHKKFYDNLAEEDVFKKFKKKQKTLLYAPTWKDPENSSSFFDICAPLLEQLPEHYNLLIKLHPNLENDDPAKVYHLIGKYEHKQNVVFLTQYPLVYPILEKIDVYLGDFSSVGYDFLTFNKPMFFFNPKQRDPSSDEGLYLFRCGNEIPLSAYPALYNFIESSLKEDQKNFSCSRKKMYEYTFEKKISFSEIRQNIQKVISNTSAKHYTTSF